MSAAFTHFLYWIAGIFMAPGYIFLHTLTLPSRPLWAFLAAFVLWAMFFTLLGSMQDSIRRMLHRNDGK